MRPLRRQNFAKVSREATEAFETWTGWRLPESYKEFLAHCNGGYSHLNAYVDLNGSYQEINNFYGLGARDADIAAAAQGEWDFDNLWGETRKFHELVGKVGVPIGRDGGDNQLFLEKGDSAEYGLSQLIIATREMRPVASDFESFIDTLQRSSS